MRFCLILITVLLSACVERRQLPVKTSNDDQPRASLSQRQCRVLGGVEVGDIGDGRIHRSNYLCENGEPVLGTIIAEEGQPIPIEGSVCCGVNH